MPIVVYKIDSRPGLYLSNRLFFTHAWFSRNRFDKVLEQNSWIFGRKGDGYLALFSLSSWNWPGGRVKSGIMIKVVR